MQASDYPPNRGQSKSVSDQPDDITDDEIAEAIAKASGNEPPPPPLPGAVPPISAIGDGDPAPSNEQKSEEHAAEIAALKDQLLRVAADLENTRRRAEREKIDTSRYAIANFAHDLLSVADNFERALTISDTNTAEQAAETLTTLLAGLRMTEKELQSAFERHGVKRIHPKGEKFDPNIHQAVANQPSNDVPKGHIVDVAQTGFVIGERVLRAPMVTVSSGPAAQSAEPNSDQSPGANVDTQA